MSRTERKRRRCGTRDDQPAEKPCGLENLPPEVLETVFRFLPYHDLATNVRLVSRKCGSVATVVLNNGLLSAGARLRSALGRLEAAANRARDELSLVVHGRARNSLELVRAHYELVRAVVWRYTHPPRNQRFERLCFYGGSILDELDLMLRDARACPELLLDKDGPAPRVDKFAATCKKFMNYFEKVSEKRVNSKSNAASGCKPVDLLDCLAEGRQVVSLRVTEGRGDRGSSLGMRLRYVMKRTWFTCLEVPAGPDDEVSWRDQQRFMYLRLRRLVASVNEHLLEARHYETELAMHTGDLLPAPRPPPCSSYLGYGEYGGRFYYYGNMNEYAYDCKVMDTWRRHSERDRKLKLFNEKKPCYDLVIDVDLRCSLELAPLAVRSLLKCDDFENTTSINPNKPELYLKLNISCPASTSNKLPGNFVWEVRTPRRHKSHSSSSKSTQ